MAYIETVILEDDEGYSLGYYTFELERTSVPGSTNDKIEAIFTDKDGKNARKSIQVPSSTQVLGWYVEANETEATVYAVIESKTSLVDGDLNTITLYGTVSLGDGYYVECPYETKFTKTSDTYGLFSMAGDRGKYTVHFIYPGGGSRQSCSQFTYNDETVTYGGLDPSGGTEGRQKCVRRLLLMLPSSDVTPQRNDYIAWSMIYASEDESIDKIVGRFAIEIEDAGGVGPGSDWIDPGDYDPDWEPEDPTHTLYVEVTGALSGRHNDPIVDPSYSYIPADKDTVKDYGCGGDGGHGGGGGAGASTVVIHKFATNQANSKEVTAIARRHGYGSGGGKGGKGGDGCILIYY